MNQPWRQLGLGVVVPTILLPTLLVLACVSPASPATRPPVSSSSPGPAASSVVSSAASASASPSSQPSAPVISEAPPQPPPDARLTAGSAEAVTGAVGTFVWDGIVSDSPWLPGHDVRTSRGQELRIETTGPTPVRWSALIAPAGSGGSGAVDAGTGDGRPVLKGPATRGAWELAVKIEFAAGEVRYHWRLIVA